MPPGGFPLNELINGKCGITPETTWLLSKVLDTTPEFWMNLQAQHDLAKHRPEETFGPFERTSIIRGTGYLQAMSHLRDAQVTSIVREYRSGADVPALAARFSVTPKTIYHWLKIKKVEKRGAKGYAGKLDEAQVAVIVREYKSGSLAASLAARFGVSERTIHYWLKIKKVATRAATTARSRADQIMKSVRAYKRGVSVALLAGRFGVAAHTIYHWLRINKVVLTSATAQAPRLREDQVAEIVRAYKSGVSTPLLAARFGVSTGVISRWLRIKKVVTRTGAPPRLVPYDVLCADYLSGLTQEQVAKKYNVSVGVVCRALRLSGIAARPPPRGPAHPAWKAQKINYHAYTVLSDGRLLHREVAERLLGRSLRHWEASHHVDADRHNNADENIVAMPEREHNRFHMFLRHRGLSASRENLEKFCRQESPAYFRFTSADRAHWSGELQSIIHLGRPRKPPQKCRIKSCSTICKTIRGLCNKHYQRKRARARGYWTSGGGRRHPFMGTHFKGERKGVPRTG